MYIHTCTHIHITYTCTAIVVITLQWQNYHSNGNSDKRDSDATTQLMRWYRIGDGSCSPGGGGSRSNRGSRRGSGSDHRKLLQCIMRALKQKHMR